MTVVRSPRQFEMDSPGANSASAGNLQLIDGSAVSEFEQENSEDENILALRQHASSLVDRGAMNYVKST